MKYDPFPPGSALEKLIFAVQHAMNGDFSRAETREARAALRVLAGHGPARRRICANGCGRPPTVHRCAWKLWFCSTCALRRCHCGKRSLAHWVAWVDVGGKAHAHRYKGAGRWNYQKVAECGRPRGRGFGALVGGFHGGVLRCKTCVRLTTAGRMSV